jgi:hypothetical protein
MYAQFPPACRACYLPVITQETATYKEVSSTKTMLVSFAIRMIELQFYIHFMY